MKIYRTINPQKLRELLEKVQQELHEWKVIELNVETESGDVNLPFVMKQMDEYFGIWDGAIFVCSPTRILILARLGSKTELPKIKQGMIEKLPEYKCEINANAISAEGIRKIEIKLTDVARVQPSPETSKYDLLKKRKGRENRIFFVVDDDMFMRSLIAKALAPHGKVVEMTDGKNFVSQYLKELPDVVFLDIHLPGVSGLELLREAIEYDFSAGIIMLSSDSVKDNVLLAQACGAKGFVAKPFTKEKIEESARKCMEQAKLLARMC